MPQQASDPAYTCEFLTADLNQLQDLLADFFSNISAANPQQPTQRDGAGWTLHQTLAHVSAISEAFYQALDRTLAGQPLVSPGLEKRTDLRSVNERAIQDRKDVPMKTLVETLLAQLHQTASCAKTLTPDQLALPVTIRAYNRPLTVAELISAQLSHIGIVHAAQLANGICVRPLWLSYPRDLMERQITRFFNVMSHAYWPEHGGDMNTGINFRVGVQGPGWYLLLRPDGGETGPGSVKNAALNIWTPTTHALCNLVTIQSTLAQAILKGQLIAWGNLRLAFKMGYLFEN